MCRESIQGRGVPHPGGAAAAAVVVPETRAKPLWDTGGKDRVQAPLPQPRDLEPGDRVHAGVRQCGEQVRRSRRSVAPGVGHRIHVPAGVRQGVRDDEPAVVQRAHGEQVLRALPRSRDEVITVQGHPGYRQRRGYPSGTVRVVRHPGRPARQHSPVQTVLGLVCRSQQPLATGRDGEARAYVTFRSSRSSSDTCHSRPAAGSSSARTTSLSRYRTACYFGDRTLVFHCK